MRRISLGAFLVALLGWLVLRRAFRRAGLMALALQLLACYTPRVLATIAPKPERVVFSRRVTDNLRLLWNELDVELMLCLEGRWREDGTVTIYDFRFPHIVSATDHSVGTEGGCADVPFTPGLERLAVFHTHPDGGCYLSRTDMTTFARARDYALSIVMCDSSKAAWWHVTEIDLNRIVLTPIGGQWVEWQEE
jgi:hypothetical protein